MLALCRFAACGVCTKPGCCSLVWSHRQLQNHYSLLNLSHLFQLDWSIFLVYFTCKLFRAAVWHDGCIFSAVVALMSSVGLRPSLGLEALLQPTKPSLQCWQQIGFPGIYCVLYRPSCSDIFTDAFCLPPLTSAKWCSAVWCHVILCFDNKEELEINA